MQEAKEWQDVVVRRRAHVVRLRTSHIRQAEALLVDRRRIRTRAAGYRPKIWTEKTGHMGNTVGRKSKLAFIFIAKSTLCLSVVVICVAVHLFCQEEDS